MGQHLDGSRPLWRRRSVLVAGTAGVATAGVASVARIVWRPAATSAAPAGLPLATATITRQTLVDVRSVPGQLAYGAEQRVESPLEGIVTWLPEIGTIIERGKALLRINDLPVVLLYGALPAYRELAVPTKGNDVKQFEENLKALGYFTSNADQDFAEGTGKAVRQWQKDLGLEQTGAVGLGRVFYAPGPVRITSQDLVVGQKVSGPMLTYTATTRMVTAGLKSHEQELAKKGTAVTIALPNGKEIAGRVESARTKPETGDGAQGSGLEDQVSLVDGQAVDGLEDGPVIVRTVAGERKDVLVVPVAALLALAEGGFGLEVIEGQSSRIVAVKAGLFANGNVEVSGPGAREGMTVGVAP